MLEYIGQAIMSLDLLNMGAFLVFFSLGIGISYLITEEMEVFLIINKIWNYLSAITLWVLTKESYYFIIVTIFLIIIMIMPTGISEGIFKKFKRE